MIKEMLPLSFMIFFMHVNLHLKFFFHYEFSFILNFVSILQMCHAEEVEVQKLSILTTLR